jgi:glycosyltransferase involved in cell wall biosynthesis
LKKALENEPENSEITGFIKQVENAISQQQVAGSLDSGFGVRDSENGIIENKGNGNYTNYSSAVDKKDSEKKLISLSMIVKNEEDNIEECLGSVIDVVDEIIIVDTGSIDRTKEIAEKYGAKLFDFDWIDDFAAARNESLKHCTGEWILYLDADERLDESSRGNLRALLESANEGIGGFICTLESLHVQLDGNKEKHRGGYPRIFRNYGYPRIHFKGRVHEQITPSIFELGKSIPFSDIIIQHMGYNQSREVMEGKIKRNYRMLIRHVQEEPLNGYAWYQLGQTLAQMQLVKEAEETIRFAIEAGNLSDSVYASATATLSQLTGNKKNFKEALYWAEKSLGKASGQVYALHLKAYSLMYLERFDEAEAVFLEVLRRMKEKKGVPHAGFDIELDENLVLKGLEETRKRIGS